MTLIDELRADTQRRRDQAIPAEWNKEPGKPKVDRSIPPSSQASVLDPAADDPTAEDAVPDRAHRAREGPASYGRYWAGVFERAQRLPLAEAACAIAAALASAPAALRPPPADVALFQAAGAGTLSCGDIARWLRLRAALGDGAGVVDSAVAQYWLYQLDHSAELPGPDWPARCARLTQAAARAGVAPLDTALRRVLQTHPDWILAYLRCAAAKARWTEAASHAATPTRAEADDSPAVLRPAVGISGESSGTPTAIPTPGAARAGLTPAPLGLIERVRRLQATYQRRQALAALTEAEEALARLMEDARRLRDHPCLAPLWRQIDHHAAAQGSDRTALYRAMADEAHPLRAELAEQVRAHPALAQWFAQAYAAFDHLGAVWEQCVVAHAKLGIAWQPTDEQRQALRTACLNIPPWRPGASALVEQAEHLARRLAEFLNSVLQGHRPAAPAAASPLGS